MKISSLQNKNLLAITKQEKERHSVITIDNNNNYCIPPSAYNVHVAVIILLDTLCGLDFISDK